MADKIERPSQDAKIGCTGERDGQNWSIKYGITKAGVAT
jgi:hypothetical protein